MICMAMRGEDEHAGMTDDGDTNVRCMFDQVWCVHRTRVKSFADASCARGCPRATHANHANHGPHHEMRARTRRRSMDDLGVYSIAVRTRWRPVNAWPPDEMISKGRHSGYPMAMLNLLITSLQLASW